MSDFADVLRTRFQEFPINAINFDPVPSEEVPNGSIFRNSDGLENNLCYKDSDGDVFEFRMRAI